ASLIEFAQVKHRFGRLQDRRVLHRSQALDVAEDAHLLPIEPSSRIGFDEVDYSVVGEKRRSIALNLNDREAASVAPLIDQLPCDLAGNHFAGEATDLTPCRGVVLPLLDDLLLADNPLVCRGRHWHWTMHVFRAS